MNTENATGDVGTHGIGEAEKCRLCVHCGRVHVLYCYDENTLESVSETIRSWFTPPGENAAKLATFRLNCCGHAAID